MIPVETTKIKGITMVKDLTEEILSLVSAPGKGAIKSQNRTKFSNGFLPLVNKIPNPQTKNIKSK